MHQPVYYEPPKHRGDPSTPLLAALPNCVLLQLLSQLPVLTRCALRLACRSLSAAAAGAFDALAIDVTRFESGGAAAAASLSRACPLARRAVLRVRVDAPPPNADALRHLFSILAASKPHLEALSLEETHPCLPPFDPRATAALEAARWRYGAALAAAAAAEAGDPCGSAFAARLRRLELPPGALGHAPAGSVDPFAHSAAADGACSAVLDRSSRGGKEDGGEEGDEPRGPVAAIRRLSGLREVLLREPEPETAPGLAPAALREVAAIAGLVKLCVDLDSRAAVEAFRAVVSLPAAPAAATLTHLRLGCAGPGELRLPARGWLLALPRLRRLDLGRGMSLDCSDLVCGTGAGGTAGGSSSSTFACSSESVGVEQQQQEEEAAVTVACGATRRRLPPLEHVSLSQPSLDTAGWRLLASLPHLSALELWRCGPPPPGTLPFVPPTTTVPAAARPFPALSRLHLGCSGDDASAALATAATLPRLSALSLHRAGGGGFCSADPSRLAPLTGLTRLVLMPVAPGCSRARWAGARVPVTPEEGGLLMAMPRLQFYDGPTPGADPAGWDVWAAAGAL